MRANATRPKCAIRDAGRLSETSPEAIKSGLWKLIQTRLPVTGPKRLRKSTTLPDLEAEEVVDEEYCDDDNLESQHLFGSFNDYLDRDYD